MTERIRVDRDHRKRSPEEVAIESWVEDLGVYLTIPADDTLRDHIDIDRTASPAAGRGK
jgi:hypothetical protein